VFSNSKNSDAGCLFDIRVLEKQMKIFDWNKENQKPVIE
jgi:hypothetical protein